MKAVVASLLAIASASSIPPDPPSRSLDPPLGPQDYIGTFRLHSWTFGKLLWQGREPCTKDFCEAAYNARPVYLLVQKEKNCCNEAGYSLTIVGRVEACSSVSYYLTFSKDFDKLSKAQRLAFLSRHVMGVASGVASECGKSLSTPIPTKALSRLWM